MKMTLWNTLWACPSQWEGVADPKLFVYARHRHGYTAVYIGPTLDDAILSDNPLWESQEGKNDGTMWDEELIELMAKAGHEVEVIPSPPSQSHIAPQSALRG